MPTKRKPTQTTRKPSAAALSAARLQILEQLRADLDLGPLQHASGYDKGVPGFGRYGKA